MYNHNKAQQSKNRVHISWDILYVSKHWTDSVVRILLSVRSYYMSHFYYMIYIWLPARWDAILSLWSPTNYNYDVFDLFLFVFLSNVFFLNKIIYLPYIQQLSENYVKV